MSLIGRQVSSVRLHVSTHITGLGNLGPNVSKTNDPTGVKGKIQMEVVEHGVLVKAGKFEAVLGSGNIISYELEPLVEAPKGISGGNSKQYQGDSSTGYTGTGSGKAG